MIQPLTGNRVLVIAAHPDDEVLGCGGMIARLAREGCQVYVSILGEGLTSRYSQRDQAEPAKVKRLRDCCQEVAKLLGAKDLILYDLPDNRFDTVPLLDVVNIIEGLVEKISPQVIYTHHGGDLNVDHRITCQATLAATRPLPGNLVKAVYAYEVPSSTEWAFHNLSPVFKPNVYVDITDTLKLKIKAMQMYESEVRPYPHPRSPEALLAISRRWGSVVGLEAVEAFELVREIR
jgi:LmbE family N-acetylglucosaminyl deacetylase